MKLKSHLNQVLSHSTSHPLNAWLLENHWSVQNQLQLMLMENVSSQHQRIEINHLNLIIFEALRGGLRASPKDLASSFHVANRFSGIFEIN